MSVGGKFKRTPGQVISLRLRPEDCVRILDLADRTGVRGSFPQKVSLVINGLLVAAEQSGLIPEPDMFSYGPRMQQALSPRNGGAVAELVAPVLNRTSGEAPRAFTPAINTSGMMPEEAAGEFSKLQFKQEYDPANFTEEDLAAMDRFHKIAWPD